MHISWDILYLSWAHRQSTDHGNLLTALMFSICACISLLYLIIIHIWLKTINIKHVICMLYVMIYSYINWLVSPTPCHFDVTLLVPSIIVFILAYWWPGIYFTKFIWAHNLNLVKNIVTLIFVLVMKKIAYTTTAQLLWHVQNCDIISVLCIM